MFGCAWGWSVARYTDCKKCCQENSSHVDTIVRLGSSVNLLGEVTATPRLVMEMRMNPKYLIYGLIDPRNGQLRYVGKTSGQLSIRLAHHVHRSLHHRSESRIATNRVKRIG